MARRRKPEISKFKSEQRRTWKCQTDASTISLPGTTNIQMNDISVVDRIHHFSSRKYSISQLDDAYFYKLKKLNEVKEGKKNMNWLTARTRSFSSRFKTCTSWTIENLKIVMADLKIISFWSSMTVLFDFWCSKSADGHVMCTSCVVIRG